MHFRFRAASSPPTILKPAPHFSLLPRWPTTIKIMKTSALPPLLLLAPLALRRTLAFVLPPSSPIAVAPSSAPLLQLHHADDVRASSPRTQLQAAAGDGTDGASTAELSRAPTLNGKAVLPVRAMTAGLKGHTVAAVYAVLNADYTRGSGEGWEHVEHVGVTRDLAADLSHFLNEKGASDVAHVRALSFAYPQKAAMDDFAAGWRMKVAEAGGAGSGEGWGTAEGGANGSSSSGEEGAEMATPAAAVEGASNIITVGDEYEFDDDDEDMDDDDLDDYLQMMAEARGATSSPAAPAPAPLFVDNTGLSGIVSLGGGDDKATEKEEVVSPFDKAVDKATVAAQSLAPGEDLELNADNVDRVLDEVRPYLISDGGNVSVHSVDSQTGNVFLLLEGACGSCASSTVTMQMGIERVLREKFGDRLGEVAQIDPDDGTDGGAPKELTLETVQAEVDRISTAIIAMGGVVRVVGVDPVGEVEVEFRGPNRVRKGLELALLDVEFVKHVKFVS